MRYQRYIHTNIKTVVQDLNKIYQSKNQIFNLKNVHAKTAFLKSF